MKLVLIGMMGTGKSTIGKLLAAKIGAVFLDTDQLIEARIGKRIAEIFANSGEIYFRKLEHELALELSQTKQRQVIATGGGFVLNQSNLEIFRPQGLIIALTATPETIYQRVNNDQERPLLAVADPLVRIRELLKERETNYAQADLVVDTSNLIPDEIVTELIKLIPEQILR